MKIIMIDDEKLALSELSEILLEHYPDAEINCFTDTASAIGFLKNNLSFVKKIFLTFCVKSLDFFAEVGIIISVLVT